MSDHTPEQIETQPGSPSFDGAEAWDLYCRTCEQGCNGCDDCTDYDYDESDEPKCSRCHGDGMDPWTDYALPCPACGGRDLP